MLVKTSTIAVAVLMGATVASAGGYECRMTPGRIIPPVITVETDGHKVTVMDRVIEDIHGKPIVADIAVDNDRRVTYSWKIKGLKGRESHFGSSVTPQIRYRLTRQKTSNAASISVKVIGYVNTDRSSGKCRPIK